MTRALRDYLAERVRPGVFVPALAGLWLSACWAAGIGHPWSAYVLSLLLMAVLILQFRLWDDLEDVERDRLVHPDRLLVRSPLRPFHRLLGTVTVLAIGLSAAVGPVVFAGVAGLDVLFLLAYRLIRPHVPDVVWRFFVLLAKYPAFVCLAAVAIGAAPDGRLAIAMFAAMTGACAFEAVHTRDRADGVAL